MSGRGVFNGVMPLPPLTHVNFTMTLSKNRANANVASERKIPPSRSAGSATQRADRGRDAPGDQHADEHRHPELVRELTGRERTDAREGRLAQARSRPPYR